MKEFGYNWGPETCLWCGGKLPKKIVTEYERATEWSPPKKCNECDGPHGKKTWEPIVDHFFRHACGCEMPGERPRKVISQVDTGERGWNGAGHFCSLTCGWRFGLSAARAGFRIEKAKSK